MALAADRGARRVIVGIGGTAMNDGGIGMVQAAGGRVLDGEGRQVPRGIYGLRQVSRVEPGDIPERFKGIEVIGICDVDSPLTGPQGATWVYGPQKGLKGQELHEVDGYMDRYGQVLARDLGRIPGDYPGQGPAADWLRPCGRFSVRALWTEQVSYWKRQASWMK